MSTFFGFAHHSQTITTPNNRKQDSKIRRDCLIGRIVTAWLTVRKEMRSPVRNLESVLRLPGR